MANVRRQPLDLNTNGSCLLCLENGSSGPVAGSTLQSFEKVTQYLKMDVKMVMQREISKTFSLLEPTPNDVKWEVKGLLCEKCSEIIFKFTEKIVELEKLQMILDFHTRQLKEQIALSQDLQDRFLTDMLRDPLAMFSYSYVDIFRKETMRKCSVALKETEPRVVMVKLEPGTETEIAPGASSSLANRTPPSTLTSPPPARPVSVATSILSPPPRSQQQFVRDLSLDEEMTDNMEDEESMADNDSLSCSAEEADYNVQPISQRPPQPTPPTKVALKRDPKFTRIKLGDSEIFYCKRVKKAIKPPENYPSAPSSAQSSHSVPRNTGSSSNNEGSSVPLISPSVVQAPTSTKRGRGRPRKVSFATPPVSSTFSTSTTPIRKCPRKKTPSPTLTDDNFISNELACSNTSSYGKTFPSSRTGPSWLVNVNNTDSGLPPKDFMVCGIYSDYFKVDIPSEGRERRGMEEGEPMLPFPISYDPMPEEGAFPKMDFQLPLDIYTAEMNRRISIDD